MYGSYGYLDLIDKIGGDFNSKFLLTEKITKEFEKKLLNICKYGVQIYSRIKCPKCGSNKILVVDETLENTIPISWLEINIENI